ncbi:MAG: 4-(cytidine 5'-diphospho)-2-C-methyl-D-erythritol kinase [Coriobacteriales bacterium]|nr:4-(cytidine 5'-diphospho)-2-C-methyl-D-erythritol kinase [Coriobacteriales bacterium]
MQSPARRVPARRVTLNAPAKLNLHLGIYTQLDERRYHRADSLMVALDLVDTVTVEELGADASGQDSVPLVTCIPPVDIPAHKNTAFRAATELGKRVQRKPAVRIEVVKRVPAESGMGGASADAAATILALCELWDVDPADERVVAAARAVGADVPFFLNPVPTLLTGAGDVVEKVFPPLSKPLSVVLVRPAGPGVSTPAAYAAFDKNPLPPADPAPLCALLEQGDPSSHELAQLLANNLDPVACELLPADAEVRAWLLAQDGVLGGQVTGSGSCVFGICACDEDAERVARQAREIFGAWAKSAHIAAHTDK